MKTTKTDPRRGHENRLGAPAQVPGDRPGRPLSPLGRAAHQPVDAVASDAGAPLRSGQRGAVGPSNPHLGALERQEQRTSDLGTSTASAVTAFVNRRQGLLGGKKGVAQEFQGALDRVLGDVESSIAAYEGVLKARASRPDGAALRAPNAELTAQARQATDELELCAQHFKNLFKKLKKLPADSVRSYADQLAFLHRNADAAAERARLQRQTIASWGER